MRKEDLRWMIIIMRWRRIKTERTERYMLHKFHIMGIPTYHQISWVTKTDRKIDLSTFFLASLTALCTLTPHVDAVNIKHQLENVLKGIQSEGVLVRFWML
jgi:hypothetical protein